MRVRAVKPFWIGGYPVLLNQQLDVANPTGRVYIKRGDAVQLKPSREKKTP